MKLQDFLQWGEQALALRHVELAEEIARYLLQQSPNNLGARTLLGRVHLESGRFEQAEEHLVQALDIDPENPVALTMFAEVLEAQGREEETLAVLRRAFECDPTRTAVKQRMVALQSGRDGAHGSETLLTRLGLARIHLRSGLLEHAIGELRQLLEARAVHWSAQVALMEAHWLNGDRQATVRLADEIVRAHPNCLKAILLSADVRAHMGLMDQARQFFERARQVDPDFALARALYPANGPSRLPIPSDDAEIEAPLDFLQRIEAALAAKEEPEPTEERPRAAAQPRERAAQDAPEDAQRILVTPAPSAEPEAAEAETAELKTAEPEATEPETIETAAPDSPVAPAAKPAAGADVWDTEAWDALLLSLEREGGQLDEAALDAMAQRLETLADSAQNTLQTWQQLGDVYQRIGQTERAMRAYMRALDSSSARQ